MPIEQFKINEKLLSYLKEKKITDFSEVQNQVIPLFLKQKTVLIESPTGTGKTLAYLLPILNNISVKNSFNAVIIVPTRELAYQIKSTLQDIYKHYPAFTYLISTGGESLKQDGEKFLKKPNILVATPTRIMSLLENYYFDFKDLKTIIIDEIDMIYNFNFLDEIYLLKKIFNNSNINWGLLSASFSIPLMNFIENKLGINAFKKISIKVMVDDKININIIKTFEDDKKNILWKLLTSNLFNPYFCLIFAKSSNEVNEIYKFLRAHNLKDVYFFNNQLNAQERKKILSLIFEQKVTYLITTDLIARGMDFSGVSHIINFNYPIDLNYYKHRIGRTNRLNNVRGNIYDLVGDFDFEKIKKIEQKNKNLIFNTIKL